MRRHLIVGRFGHGDRTAVPAATDEVVSLLPLIDGDRLRNGIGRALGDLRKMHLAPSEVGLDLLIVAAHVHAADTRLSRETEAQDGWTREIRLVVPVSDPELWTAASRTLRRMLNFLTGDKWTIGFRKRPKVRARLVPPLNPDLVPPPFDGVQLFSGGLDSLIGAIDDLSNGHIPLLISHAGEGLVSKSQEECFETLRGAFPKTPFDRLRMWMAFRGELFDVASENTTRGRSFLFFALGAAAGSAFADKFTLKVPENGLIALNVPLDALRLGSLSTRTTHPFYMARWNDLLRQIGIGGSVENPYWDKTKGEMVAECDDAALLASIIPHSLSCSSPSKERWRKARQGHCGYCLPCLIRRAALLDSDDQTVYGIDDLAEAALNTEEAEGQQARSFQVAISRLDERPALAKLLIHKPGPLYDVSDRLDALAAVYRRGMSEVARLLEDVHTTPKS